MTAEHVDHDAERALLGTILAVAETDRDHAVKLLDATPPPADFDRPAHEEIAAQLHHNAAEGHPLDAVAVLAGLNRRKARVGGAPYLHTLVSAATTPHSVTYYADRIRTAAMVRRAYGTVSRALNRLAVADISDPGDARSALFEAMSDLEDLATPPDTTTTGTTAWRYADLNPVIDGTWERATPSIGQRSDSVPILYPGRTHALNSESESGKSWAALIVSLQEMNKNHHVLYLDFEDDEGEIGNRLLLLGAHPTRILTYFHYVKIEEPITMGRNANWLVDQVTALQPTLAILDGVTEAMTMHGYDPNKNDEVALFNRLVPGRLASLGPAALSLDHVTKDTETRGRYAIGAVHKLNAITGAAFSLENRAPFGIGITGRSNIYVMKDRPGQLRRHTNRDAGGRHWFGDLTVSPLDIARGDYVIGAIEAPIAHHAPFRPTILMQRISDVMQKAGPALTQTEVLKRSTGNKDELARALYALVDEGYVKQERGPRGSKLHTLTRPFTNDPEADQ